MGDNMKNAQIEVLEVFYKENLTRDHIHEALNRLLYLCHYCILPQSLFMLKLIFEVVVKKNISVNKSIINAIKSEYGYCNLSFLKSVKVNKTD